MNLSDKSRPLVLVIDDDPMIRETISDIFAEINCEIVLASNGQKGIALFEQRSPDLVVTDMIMPVTEGVETIVEIRRKAPNVGIIAISGGGRTRQFGFLKVAEKFGADIVLSKPLDLDEFVKAAQSLLPKS